MARLSELLTPQSDDAGPCRHAEWQSYWQPSPGDVANETAAFKGGWLAQQSWRASCSAEFHLQDFIAWDLRRLSDLMLLGMALLK